MRATALKTLGQGCACLALAWLFLFCASAIAEDQLGAVQRYQPAAEQGDAEAQFNLGLA